MKQLIVLLVFLAFAIMIVRAQDPPMPKSLDPTQAKVGQQVTLHGDHLGSGDVEGVFLSATSEVRDYMTTTVKQSENEITFIVPESAKPGTYGISLMPKSDRKTILWFPGVKLTVLKP